MTSIVGDLGPCIDDIASEFTVTRVTASTTFVKGRPVAVATNTILIRGVHQPVSGRDRDMLPENIRDSEVSKFYVSDSNLLNTVDIVGKKKADRISIEGRNYVVQTEFDWRRLGGFRRYALIKVND